MKINLITYGKNELYRRVLRDPSLMAFRYNKHFKYLLDIRE